MSLSAVQLPNKYQEAAIEYAESLLKRAQAGEITSVSAIEEHPDGSYTLAGSLTMSRLQTAGALLEAAIWRLK